MNTDVEIKRIAHKITPYYVYGTYYSINQAMDRLRRQRKLPVCLHLQTFSGSAALSDGAFYDRERRTSKVQVGFAEAVKFDQDPELTIAVVEGLVDKCSELVRRMNESGLWEHIDAYHYEVLYNALDANLVFVLASFDATERVGRCSAES